MTRSPLTLAAAATAALPRVRVVAAGPLTSGGAGRCDSAVLTLDDGRMLVIRVPVDASAAGELAAEALALRALTPGVRGLLGVRAPELLGEAGLGDVRALVTDLLPGYQVEAAHLPAGPGAAPSVGRALASVHALPASVVRSEGLGARTSDEVRAATSALIDRTEATGRAPRDLIARWRDAVECDALWRFESTVTLGGATATSFLFEDTEAGPTVTGVLDWHGLSLGDPAVDLRWAASAPDAADDVFTAYQDASHRAPDAGLSGRARLYAELEFAKWLVHGADEHRADVIADAVGLLESLAETVRDDDLIPRAQDETLTDAMAILGRVAPQIGPGADTSMQTDAYDPEELAFFVDDRAADDSPGDSVAAPAAPSAGEDTATAPIDIIAWADARATAEHDDGADADPEADAAEAERASRDALRRWAASE